MRDQYNGPVLWHTPLVDAWQQGIDRCTGLPNYIKWKHFLPHWPFVRGIHWWPVDSPHTGQWRKALSLMFSLIYAWTKGWTNNQDASDLRSHLAHYDVTVMTWAAVCIHNNVYSAGIPEPCAWTNGWANNQDASDLRSHHFHYDVTVMAWTVVCYTQ